MQYYPLFLDLSRTHCLIVGAGEVGRRKLATVLESAPASVLVLDVFPPSDELEAVLAADSRVTFEQRAFTPADVKGRTLIFAATGNRDVNAAVSAACARQNVLCNCADAPREGNCIVPATARKDPLVAALSTGGGSPALARRLRRELEFWLEPRAALARLMGRLRPHVLAMPGKTGQNTALFRTLTYSSLQEALELGDRARCEALLRELLPDALHPHIPELLYDLV